MHVVVGVVLFLDFGVEDPFVVLLNSVISLDNCAFSFVTWSNSSLDSMLTPVLVVASMVPGINMGADHAWVDSPLFIGASSMEYSA